jgi:ADP-ribosyl-[dinitrogen reductase] hydrolase
VRLVDQERDEANQNLDFVLMDTARLIESLRAEGRTVLVHCRGAYSRTPMLGALYGARRRGVSGAEALADVLARLPGGNSNSTFRAALNRLAS